MSKIQSMVKKYLNNYRRNKMEKVKELHAKIKEHFAEFDKNHEEHSEKGN